MPAPIKIGAPGCHPRAVGGTGAAPAQSQPTADDGGRIGDGGASNAESNVVVQLPAGGAPVADSAPHDAAPNSAHQPVHGGDEAIEMRHRPLG
jgi:hypothetical protein